MTDSDFGLGQRRFGVFTAAEARAAGLTERRHKTLVAKGKIVRLRRGLFIQCGDLERARDAPAGLEKIRAMAAALAIRHYAAASHETAAVIHGFDMLPRPGSAQLGIVHLTQIRTVSYGISRHDPGILMHCASLPETHVRHLDDLPVTSIARTLSDLARRRHPSESLVMVDSALRKGQVTYPTLQKVFGDCGAWPGHRQADFVLRVSDGKTESPLESLSRLMFAEQRSTMPESQVTIEDRDGFVGRVDFLWRAPRVVGEADGLGKYDAPEALRAEKVRQERLERLGYRVVRWMWHEVRGKPETIATRLRAAGVK